MNKKLIIIIVVILIIGAVAFYLFSKRKVAAGPAQYYDVYGNQIDPATGNIIKKAGT